MIWNLLFTLICLWRWRNVVGGLCGGEVFFNENIVVVEEKQEPEKKEEKHKKKFSKAAHFQLGRVTEILCPLSWMINELRFYLIFQRAMLFSKDRNVRSSLIQVDTSGLTTKAPPPSTTHQSMIRNQCGHGIIGSVEYC